MDVDRIFSNAIKAFFKNYVKFDGRASRSEYWWVFLFNIIVTGILEIPLLTFGTKSYDSAYNYNIFGWTIYAIMILFSLVCLTPSLSLAVRSFHDTNRPGWWFLIGFIPFIGPIILLFMVIADSNPEGSRFDGPVQPWSPKNSINNSFDSNHTNSNDVNSNGQSME